MKSRIGNADLLICILLAGSVFAVYCQVVNFDFCYYDDDYYVLKNPWVNRGFTPQTIAWAFTTNTMCNWHPVTWVSYFVDNEIGRWVSALFDVGLGPGSAALYHLTNVVLHAANSVLLFALLFGLTGCRWRGAFAAFLFALHPLNVEPVAWIAQRKDVLSTLFGLLAIHSYAAWVRNGRRGFSSAAVFIAFGLMSKPMLVTLPALLLLLDIWPLGRYAPMAMEAGARSALARLVREKWLLFVLAAASCVVTFWAQKTGGAVQTLQDFPVWTRVLNTLQSDSIYLVKMAAPVNLSVIYPHPGSSISIPLSLAAGLVLTAITVFALRMRGSRPYVTVGWLWYLTALIPVSGLVQVGDEARADRYTYIPMIGIYVLIAWAAPDLLAFVRNQRVRSAALAAAGAGVILSLIPLTVSQVGVWRDSESLFGHAIRVIPNNAAAHNGLGAAMFRRGDFTSARDHFLAAFTIDPERTGARFNYAVALMKFGELDEAEREFRALLDGHSDRAHVHSSLGDIYLLRGDYDEAAAQYELALKTAPRDAVIVNSLGTAYARRGRLRQAIRAFERAAQLNPDLQVARENLRRAREMAGED